MNKLKIATFFGAGVLALCMTGCTNIVKDPNPYPVPTGRVADIDADMTIDGNFDEARWEEARWLNGVDKINSKQSANITFTTSYGTKGVYFGMKVEEYGTNIWVNPDRASYMNSCIEMYMGPSEDTGTSRLFEFDFMANGTYTSKLRYSDWVEVKSPANISPIVASKTIGGEVNTPECTGYIVEGFFPFAYLDFVGYDVSDPDNMVLGIAPVHIFSFNYNGTNTEADRLWSQWPQEYLPNFSMWNPSSFFRFGKNGLISHKITVNQTGSGTGTVQEKSGLDYVLSGVDTTFIVQTVNNAEVKKLLINGVDYIAAGKLSKVNGEYRFTVEKPTQDIVIDIEIG